MRENNPPSGQDRAVARSVRMAMTAKKTSGRAVADAIGMPQSNFSRRTAGETPFRAEELVAVAHFLEISVDDLIGQTLPAAGVA